MSVYTLPATYAAQVALTETRHAGGFLVSVANGHRSVDRIVLAAGHVGVAGTVLGRVAATGSFAPCDAAAADGSQVAAGILYAATDATALDTHAAAVVRSAEVNGSELDYGAADAAHVVAMNSQLASVGIVVR